MEGELYNPCQVCGHDEGRDSCEGCRFDTFKKRVVELEKEVHSRDRRALTDGLLIAALEVYRNWEGAEEGNDHTITFAILNDAGFSRKNPVDVAALEAQADPEEAEAIWELLGQEEDEDDA